LTFWYVVVYENDGLHQLSPFDMAMALMDIVLALGVVLGAVLGTRMALVGMVLAWGVVLEVLWGLI